MTGYWIIIFHLESNKTRPASRARRSGRRFANLARWVGAVFAKQVGGHLVGDYLVFGVKILFMKDTISGQVEGKETQ